MCSGDSYNKDSPFSALLHPSPPILHNFFEFCPRLNVVHNGRLSDSDSCHCRNGLSADKGVSAPRIDTLFGGCTAPCGGSYICHRCTFRLLEQGDDYRCPTLPCQRGYSLKRVSNPDYEPSIPNA